MTSRGFLTRALGGEAEQAEADLFWSHPVNPRTRPKYAGSRAGSRTDPVRRYRRSILCPCKQRKFRFMHWSSCAEREITPIDTLPSRSLWSTSRRWRRSPNFTFTASSLPPTGEHRQRTSPSAELNGHKICSDRRTSPSRRSVLVWGSAASVRSAAASARSWVRRRARSSNGMEAMRLGYRVATSS